MVERYPKRIVTLLPSATEIVCGMGLFDRLIGVTHECDFPVEITSLPRVTRSAIPEGLASSDIDAQRAMQDLDILMANLDRDRLACIQANQVHVLDGNAWFSRPGPRLIDGMEHLAGIVARARDQVA